MLETDNYRLVANNPGSNEMITEAVCKK